MSEDFVTKPYPMNELLLFLQRWKADPTEVSLAPVFYPLSVDQCSKIYADEKLWERNDREKPDDSVLKDWENAIAQLCRFTGVTPEMVRHDVPNGTLIYLHLFTAASEVFGGQFPKETKIDHYNLMKNYSNAITIRTVHP